MNNTVDNSERDKRLDNIEQSLKSSFEKLQGIFPIIRLGAVDMLLFEGNMGNEFQNQKVFEEITSRYKDSIDDFNRKIAFTLAFTVVALYVYFVLPETDTAKIPVLDLPVSRQIWIGIAPAIVYGLEIFFTTSFLWFFVLRNSVKLLIEKSKNRDSNSEFGDEARNPDSTIKQEATNADILTTSETEIEEQKPLEVFADLTNILLKGTLGDLWMIFRLAKVYESRWDKVWYGLLAFVMTLFVLSPWFTLLFFTYQLIQVGHIIVGVFYVIILIPIVVLQLKLLYMILTLALTEIMESIELK